MTAERCAAIDIGSNTVKLTVAERDAAGNLQTVTDVTRTTRLGEGIHLGRLREAAIRRTLDALREFVAICGDQSVKYVAAVGTAAIREATNRDELVRRAAEVGVSIEPIAGDEEARLSFLAVHLDPLWANRDHLMVIDIGGGSTEVIFGNGPGILRRSSTKTGAVRVSEAFLRSDPPTIGQMAEAAQAAREAFSGIDVRHDGNYAVGVGGTFVNLAAISMSEPRHVPERLHGVAIGIDDIERQIEMFAQCTVEQRRQIVGLDPARADIILGGAILLRELMYICGVDRLDVSCRGLRWGILYDRFSQCRNDALPDRGGHG